MMNRRGFFGLLAGAIAAASAGLPSIASPVEPGKLKRKVNARHLWTYDITMASGFEYLHRIDVIVLDPKLMAHSHWWVDIGSQKPVLDAERELAPALVTLGNKLDEFDCEIGEIRSYSMDQWLADRAAQDHWSALHMAIP